MRGKVVLLNFWGTWCGPCRKEIPDFINLMKKHNQDGLEIVGITLTSGPPVNIKAFSDKWGINYKLLTDIKGNETQTITALYGQVTGKRITGIPTTFIIDREGVIRKRYVGPRSESIFYNDLKSFSNSTLHISLLTIQKLISYRKIILFGLVTAKLFRILLIVIGSRKLTMIWILFCMIPLDRSQVNPLLNTRTILQTLLIGYICIYTQMLFK